MAKPQAKTLVRFTNHYWQNLKVLGDRGPYSLTPHAQRVWFRKHYQAELEFLPNKAQRLWNEHGFDHSDPRLYIVFSDARRATEFVLLYG